MTPADEVVTKAEVIWEHFDTPKDERFPQALRIWVQEAIKKALNEADSMDEGRN